MTTKTMRKIIKIDEDKCNGCGACVPACVEGALRIIDGKARLVRDSYCDGLGACLGDCPRGALTIEEREADEFDEEEALRHAAQAKQAERTTPCACPSSAVATFAEETEVGQDEVGTSPQPSRLSHWPVQLTLVPPTAPFLRGADVLLAAHCAPFAYGGFHQEFLKDHVALAACPKLDDFEAHLAKLTEVLKKSGLRSLTLVRMEVPCCGGLTYMARRALIESGVDVPLREVVIGVRGDRKS